MSKAVTSSIETKKPKPVVKRKRKRKKKGKNYYFNQGTEKAIIRYNKTDDAGLKNIIYNEHIAKAFDKLAENIIHTFKFYYFDVSSEEVKHEVVSFMVMNMHKFKEGKGKAFSYFSIVAKNYLILHNNKNYKKLKQIGQFADMEDSYKQAYDVDHSYAKSLSDFIDTWVDETYLIIDELFVKEQDKRIADAVLTIFKTRHDLDIFKKKALYIYIREMTDCDTPNLTKVINVLKANDVRMTISQSKIEVKPLLCEIRTINI